MLIFFCLFLFRLQRTYAMIRKIKFKIHKMYVIITFDWFFFNWPVRAAIYTLFAKTLVIVVSFFFFFFMCQSIHQICNNWTFKNHLTFFTLFIQNGTKMMWSQCTKKIKMKQFWTTTNLKKKNNRNCSSTCFVGIWIEF